MQICFVMNDRNSYIPAPSGQNRQKNSLKECIFVKYNAILSKIHSYRLFFWTSFLPHIYFLFL